MAQTSVDVLARFQHLFRGRENVHGVTLLDEQGQKIRSWCAEGPPKQTDWQKHLLGKGQGLGIGASTVDDLCYFGAIDVDDEALNHAALAATVEHSGLPLIVCRSKSGGAHLFLFLRDPAPAKLVMTRLREWANHLGVGRRLAGKMKGQPVEVFPKNDKLSDEDQKGNWINLPYYGNGSTNRYAILADGTKLNLAGFLDVAEQAAVSAAELQSITPVSNNPFSEGPPCLQTLHNLGLPEGSRNQGLYNMGIFFRLRAVEEDRADEWRDELKAYNSQSGKLDPPLSDREVQAIIKSLEKREYSYKCTELPIEPHCEKRACKKQVYGIDAFRKKLLASKMPEVRDLRRITTDPPRWIMNVAGSDVELTTEDLMLLPRFRKAILERCSRIFPLMKQQDWDDYLEVMLQKCEVIEAPEDAGTLGQFKYLFRDFLLRRKNAQSIEDVLAGLPVELGPRTYFRGADFLGFLDRKKFKAFDTNKVWSALREIDVGHDRKVIRGHMTQLWFVSTPDDDQTEDFTDKVTTEPEF